MGIFAAIQPDKIPDLRPPKPAVPLEPAASTWLMAAVFVLILALALGGLVLWKKQRRAPASLSSPETTALEALENLAHHNAPSRGLAIARILRVFLQSILALQPRERTTPELLNAVRSQSQLDAEPLALLENLLRDCDRMEYSPRGAGRSSGDLAERAIDLVKQIAARCKTVSSPKNSGAEDSAS